MEHAGAGEEEPEQQDEGEEGSGGDDCEPPQLFGLNYEEQLELVQTFLNNHGVSNSKLDGCIVVGSDNGTKARWVRLKCAESHKKIKKERIVQAIGSPVGVSDTSTTMYINRKFSLLRLHLLPPLIYPAWLQNMKAALMQ